MKRRKERKKFIKKKKKNSIDTWQRTALTKYIWNTIPSPLLSCFPVSTYILVTIIFSIFSEPPGLPSLLLQLPRLCNKPRNLFQRAPSTNKSNKTNRIFAVQLCYWRIKFYFFSKYFPFAGGSNRTTRHKLLISMTKSQP